MPRTLRLVALPAACLLAALSALLPTGSGPLQAQEAPAGRAIRNPYFQKTEWKVWRDDDTALENIQALVRDGKKTKVATTVLAAPPRTKRAYPVDLPADGPAGRYLEVRDSAEPSKRYAGIWDDVYTSWSGLHGYVRNRWRDPAGNSAEVLKRIIHFVDATKQNTLRAGVNFIHQSTTGMGHAITNGYIPQRTAQFERLYFADVLVTGPAHASFTEQRVDRTNDLYMALFPVIFNSVGSSNSETMAITKMILAGGYLPPETKLTLKRNGLYPSAMLTIWKAALPYTVPYDHELRHRIAYKSVGNRAVYPEKYGAAGIERGDLCLAYHCYDDAAHMRNMVEIAKSMDFPPPEAILKVLGIDGGRPVYALKKTVLVVQEKGRTVTLRVSTEDCYDLSDRPVKTRFKLLCGHPGTLVEREEDAYTYRITVPWDDALPQGRTSVALFANNGLFDGNPAVINVYRKKGPLPGTGTGPGDYKYSTEPANRRPALLGLTDQVAVPGKTLRVAVDSYDPEGFPVRLEKRAGEVGEFDGNHLVWEVPSDAKPGTYRVTVIASDGTSGDSYAGETVQLVVAPKVFARLSAGPLIGPAPLTVKVSAEGSFDRAGKTQAGWEFYAPAAKRTPKAFKDQIHEPATSHTFAKPGRYEVRLTVRGPSGSDFEAVSVLVTGSPPPTRPAGLGVEGNDVRILPVPAKPRAFDHTDFGPVVGGESEEREYRLVNLGDEPLALDARAPVTIAGPQGAEFTVARPPRKGIEGRGSTRLRIRFAPVGGGARTAVVTIHPERGDALSFAVRGTGEIDQEALDRAAEPEFAAARQLYGQEKWTDALARLRAFVAKWPGATIAEEARSLIKKIETDPAIREAIRAAEAARAKAENASKREKKAKSLWNMAENSRKNGRPDLAKKFLERLLREYPNTTWGRKAKAALRR